MALRARRSKETTRKEAPPNANGWWGGLTAGTKAFIAALAGGVVLAVVTGPLSPTLSDLGRRLNPLADSQHDPRVVVVNHGQDFAVGWMVPAPPDRIGALPGSPDGSVDLAAWRAWQSREGAVPADNLTLGLSLQGGSAKSVLITGLDIVVSKRAAPLTGTWVGEFGGNGVLSRYFAVDLDDPSGHPKVTPYAPADAAGSADPAGEGDEDRPVGFPYQVSESDLEYLVLDVRARDSYCEWVGVLHWTVDGRTGSTTIDDSGRPLRVSASVDAGTRATFRSSDPQPLLVPQ